MSQFSVVSCGITQRPIETPYGNIHARFTIKAGPLLIEGVDLISNSEGMLRWRLPKSRHGRLFIPEASDRNALFESMMAAYRALGGAHADPPLATAPHVAREAA